MYWNFYDIMNRDFILAYILGNRGSGKSFGSKKYCIEQFLKHGYQFIWSRRTETELNKTKETFFNSFPKEKLFSGVNFKINGDFLYINNKPACMFFQLSRAKVDKSIDLPLCRTIVVDEVFLDRGRIKYLPDEAEYLLALYDTIARPTKQNEITQPVKMLALGNKTDIINPHFSYFDIKIPWNSKKGIWITENHILVQILNNESYTQNRSMTKFGKLINGTPYDLKTTHNTSIIDDKTFLKTKPQNCICKYVVKINRIYYGIWYNKQLNEYYCSSKYDNKCFKRVTFDINEYEENSILITNKKNPIVAELIENFNNQTLFFEDIKSKNIFYEVLMRWI